MAKIRYIQVRVSDDQFERVKNNATAKGYKNTSQYIRDLALEKDMVFDRRFNEIYNAIMQISKILK
jgi:predicted DNA binding CopG/RHH family protein